MVGGGGVLEAEEDGGEGLQRQAPTMCRLALSLSVCQLLALGMTWPI